MATSKSAKSLLKIHNAALKGHFEICKLIASSLNGSNPTNNNGNTPLHNAAKEGHFEIYKIIAKNVVNKNTKNNENWTPLHWAAKRGDFQMCKYIVKNMGKSEDKKMFLPEAYNSIGISK